ncbi:MAG TPA: cation:proton antiporter [Candidatus Dormibacteraeota bacterium]
MSALLQGVSANDFNNVYAIAAAWIALALFASLISIRIGLAVALAEIVVGSLAGNLFHLAANDWINFLAGFGSVLLTFLAGAEIDPESFRRFLKPSLAIGGIGFAFPFAGAWAFAWLVLHWQWHASQIAGIALSTTSVAVVYAVMIETGLNKTDVGKLILTACFVCDIGTVGALGVLFAHYNILLVAFAIATAVVMIFFSRVLEWVVKIFGHAVSEPEVKFVLLGLFALGGLASASRSEAVLPAYLLGLVAAGAFHRDPRLLGRLRGTAFSFLTPFFFLRAGTLVSFTAVIAGLGAVLLLFGVKIGAKFAGVYPATLAFKVRGKQALYTTMMMSTGLTFGTISALFGYNHGYISRAQYSVLVTVVVMTALVPTLVGQLFFYPQAHHLAWGVESPPDELERQLERGATPSGSDLGS